MSVVDIVGIVISQLRTMTKLSQQTKHCPHLMVVRSLPDHVMHGPDS